MNRGPSYFSCAEKSSEGMLSIFSQYRSVQMLGPLLSDVCVESEKGAEFKV